MSFSGRNSFLRILLLSIFIVMTGCGGGGSNTSGAVEAPTNQVGEAGGTVSVDSKSSPIYGAKITVEPQSIAANETFTITHEDALPGPLNADAVGMGAKNISKTLVITRTGSKDFSKAISVTIPYDKAQLPDGAVPIVVYWDPAINGYSPVAIRSIDRTNGTLTFMTSHASKYVVIILDKLFGTTPIDASTLTTNVGFDPAVDSFFVHNFGSYDSPGGNCFGMAGYSAWYHFYKKNVKGQGLRALYKEGDLPREEDDQIARELIARVYQSGDQKAHLAALNWVRDLNLDPSFLTRELRERFIALSLIQQLVVTRQAQILAMGIGTFLNWKDGHAVTVYAYDGAKFLYYDNNYPGEVVSVPWNPTSGFGSNSKNKSYDLYAFAAFNSAYSTTTLEQFYSDAEAGFPSSHYPKIAITDPVELPSTPNTFEVPASTNITIKGSVPRPTNADNPTAQRYVHVYLNGAHYGSAIAIDQTKNTFSIPVQQLPSATGTDVMLLVSESAKYWAGGFHSFKEFKLRVANQFFFKNLGFEAGSFSDWLSERHTWLNPAQLVPSDKSLVIGTAGTDSIATDLVTPLFGRYVARVNNQDSSYHISTLAQSATVPTSTNPVLRFYWAAVLEDPQHAPDEQPYVDISVDNTTKGINLYKRRFYSNDPSYSGWQSYLGGQWKSIPWQLVELNVGAYAGDTLQLRVEAADCSLGAHGGYVYLDSEE